MKSRLKNILEGVGSILEIFPSRNYYATSKKTDAEKLRGDWEKIGTDFRNSFHNVAHGEGNKKETRQAT